MICLARWERIDGFADLLPKATRKPAQLPSYGTIVRKLHSRTTRQGKLALLATYYLRVANRPDLSTQEEQYAFLDALAANIAKQYTYPS
jgi:hypothetical protein